MRDREWGRREGSWRDEDERDEGRRYERRDPYDRSWEMERTEREWPRGQGYERQSLGSSYGGSGQRGYGYGQVGGGGSQYGGGPYGGEREYGGQSHGGYGGRQVGGGYSRPYSTHTYEPMRTWGREDRDDDRGLLERAGDWIREKVVGKPPKGYRRSDERIREDVCDLIMRRGDVDASDVEVSVSDGEVTLTGMVPDRRSKRRLEDIVEDVLGVHDVDNRVKVRREAATTTRTETGTTVTTGTPAERSSPTTGTTTTPRHRA